MLVLPKSYKEQYRQNIRLATPVIISQLGQVIVQMADNIMVGRLGAVPLAAVSFSGAIFFIFFIMSMGLTMGLTPLVGEQYAQKRHRRSAEYFQNSLLLYLVIGVLVTVAMLSITPLLPNMGQQEEVVAQATGYYKYLAWSIVPFMIFAAFKQLLEGVGNTKVVMYIVLGCNLLNIVLNYIFIYGHLGAPAMGSAGAGLATLISRICMPISIAVYFARKDSFRRYFSMFSWNNVTLAHQKTLLRVGSPIALQMLMETSAFALSSIMMGWIGAIPLAANQIAMTMASCTFMVVVGISSATTIRISHEFGRGNLRELKKAANASYHMAFAYNLCTALIFILLRNYIPTIFTDDPEVIRVASRLLLFAAVFQISDGIQIVSLGILRGMQDVKITMIIAFISYIAVNLPVGYLCAFTLKMGPGGLWLGFIFGLSLAALLLYARFRKLYLKLRLNAR